MRVLRSLLIVPLLVSLATPVVAGDLRQEVARAAQQAAAQESAPKAKMNPAVWAGASLFAGGMAVALHAFINNKNGSYTEFGEANAVNKKLGAASISAAFAGGVLLFVGTRKARHAPSVKVEPGGLSVSKQLTW